MVTVNNPSVSLLDRGFQPPPALNRNSNGQGVQTEAAETAGTARDVFQLSKSRLVVEQDSQSHRWVYKTIDAETGELLSQFPLKSVSELVLSKTSGLGLLFDGRF